VVSRSAYSMASVNRIVSVLRALAGEQGLPLVEVARRTGLDEATALRYLRSLDAHELVHRDEGSGRWSLGIELFRLGQQAVGVRGVRKLALPEMERLLEEFEETVNIGHWAGTRLVVIEVVESVLSIRKGATTGEPDVWHASGLGKAILAQMPEEQAVAVLEAHGRPRFTEHTLVGIEDLLAELARVRERGYAIDDEESEVGMRCVAAPIRDQHGQPRYAISISGVAARMPPDVVEQMGEALLGAAGRISAALGFVAQAEGGMTAQSPAKGSR
jgi:IclR family acetate operon transcriptional repressor